MADIFYKGEVTKTSELPPAAIEPDKASLQGWAPELNELYDVSTGKPIRLPMDQIPQALVNGTVGFKKGIDIPVIGPDGIAGTIPSDNISKALIAGYQLETPHQQAVREYVAANTGIKGTANVAIGQFADETLMGVPELIFDKTASPLEVAKKEALKEDHQIANTTAGIAGFGASMFVGGPLFKGAGKGVERAIVGGVERGAEEVAIKAATEEGTALATKELTNRLVAGGMDAAAAKAAAPGLLRRTAGSMARYGVEGAVINAPTAITEASLGDPAEAAEHLAVGIGTGILLGGLGPLGGKFLGLTKEMLKYSPDFLKPESLVLSGAGIERATIKKFGGIDKLENAGKILLDEGVVNKGMKFNTLQERVSDFKKVSGEEIGNIVKEVDQRIATNGQNASQLFDTSEVLTKLTDLRKEWNEPIFVKEVKELDRIISTVKKRLPDINNEIKIGAKGEGGAYAFINNTPRGVNFKVTGTLAMEEAQKLKVMIGDLSKWDSTVSSSINDVRRQAYFTIREEIDNAMGRVSEATGDPSLVQRFAKAKDNYKAASDVEYLINNKEAQIHGNRIFGLTDSIWGGGLSAAGIGGAIITGHFTPLLLPLLGAIGKKALESTYLKTTVASFLHGRSLGTGGLLFAEQAMKYSAKQLDRIPDILGNAKNVSPATTSLAAMSRFLGHKVDKTSAKDRNELLTDLSKKISELSLNSQQTADKLGNLSAPLAQGGAPKLSQAYVEQQLKTFNYLQSILPNADKTITPFKKNISQVSDQELSNFEHALRIVDNPWNILDSLQNGTVTQTEVDVLAALYPSIYREMSNKIAEFAYSGKASTLSYDYDQRLKLSLFLGIHLDQSLENVNAYQQNFAAASTKQGKGTGTKLNLITPKSNPYQTPVQKLISRH
jgi:hypothetical protein